MPDVEDLKGDVRLRALAGLEVCQGGESGGAEGLGAVGAAGVDELGDGVGVVGEVGAEDLFCEGVGVGVDEGGEVVGDAGGGGVCEAGGRASEDAEGEARQSQYRGPHVCLFSLAIDRCESVLTRAKAELMSKV